MFFLLLLTTSIVVAFAKPKYWVTGSACPKCPQDLSTQTVGPMGSGLFKPGGIANCIIKNVPTTFAASTEYTLTIQAATPSAMILQASTGTFTNKASTDVTAGNKITNTNDRTKTTSHSFKWTSPTSGTIDFFAICITGYGGSAFKASKLTTTFAANAIVCQNNCNTCSSTTDCTTCSTGYTLTDTNSCIAATDPTTKTVTTLAISNPQLCPCPGFTPCSTSPHSLKLASDITLSWRLCPACTSLSLPTISFLAIVPATTAWFAVGFRPATDANKNKMAMKTTDMTVCESNQILDYWSENMMPTIDLENNIFNASITTSNSLKEYQWSRNFNTKDTAKDHVLTVADVFEWIWVLETDASNKISTMPKRRGKFTTSLADHSIDNSASSNNPVEDGNLQNVRLAHGIIMGVGWGIFMPISALAARYLRGTRSSWLNEHVALTKIGAAGTISFIIVAIAAGPANLGNFHTHALVGVFFAIFVLSVTISGSLAKAGLKNEAKNRGSNTFRCCRVFHNVVGWMLMLVAFYQIPLGVEVLFSGMEAAASQVGAFKNYNSDGTLKTNVVLKITVLILNIFFFLVVVIMEYKRWKIGYYDKAGGCIHSCGNLQQDCSLDAFMARTHKRFTAESMHSIQIGISMNEVDKLLDEEEKEKKDESQSGEKELKEVSGTLSSDDIKSWASESGTRNRKKSGPGETRQQVQQTSIQAMRETLSGAFD